MRIKQQMAALLLAVSVAPAFAADLPSTKSPPAPPPEFAPPVDPGIWGGLFVGGLAGVGVSASEFGDPVAVNGTAFTGGLGVGYNFLIANHYVLGGVADIGYLGPIGGNSVVSSSQGGVFGTVRLRFGYAMDRLLVYGTGGLAYAGGLYPKSFYSSTGSLLYYSGPISGTLISNNGVLPGYAVGAGLEYALNNRWSVSAEYLYAHFQHSIKEYHTSVRSDPWPICNVLAVNVIRLGLNYHFGSDAPVPVEVKY
jgi:outer membrane immunogenic protein